MMILPLGYTLAWYEVFLLTVIIVTEIYGFLLLFSLIFRWARQRRNHKVFFEKKTPARRRLL